MDSPVHLHRSQRSAPFAPARFIDNVDECHFYHTLDLPGFGVQQGEWDLRGRFADYTDNFDFTGKSVLDIGTANGFLSYSAEAAGATDVVSFDLDSSIRQDFLPFHFKDYYRNRAKLIEFFDPYFETWKNGYWMAHRLFQSKARVYYGDVYKLPVSLGEFDVVILGSILEHLSDPIKAMMSAAKRARHTLLITTPMIETDEKIARFEGNCDTPEYDYVFWTYSRGTYAEVLKMLGFEIRRIARHEFVANWSDIPEIRFVITAVREGMDP